MNELARFEVDVTSPGAVAPVNALSIDVEDYFQVSAFEDRVARAEWERKPGRVVGNTDRLLEMLEEKGARATFFTLGWVAERYPELVRRIAHAGHEVASHGYEHVRVHNQTSREFRADVERTKKLLEDTTGEPVIGYRAASFSINRDTIWALDVLRETGHRYSSSVYPIRHDLYGMPDAPRFAFRHDSGLLEIPVTTLRFKTRNLPCGGGGYFRLLPYRVSRWALRRVNERERRPCVFYLHPWEIDPAQPRQGGIGLKTRVRHYLNLGRMETRLRRLLDDFRWDRMDRVFIAGDSMTGDSSG